MGFQEKERETVFFRSRGMWQSVTQKQATGHFSQLNLDNFEDLQTVWFEGPGKGFSSETVVRIIREETKKKLDPEMVRGLPPGSWISRDGQIHPRE